MTKFLMPSDTTAAAATSVEALGIGQVLYEGTVVTHTATDLLMSVGTAAFDFKGTGFGNFDSLGLPTVGTVDEIDLMINGSPVVAISDFSMSMANLRAFGETGDNEGFADALFSHNDRFKGGAAGDTLYSYGGNDKLSGRGGNDTLDGGAGSDTMFGGVGNDTFTFDAAYHSSAAAPDVIEGLQNTDVIDLSAIDADLHSDDNQAFTIVSKFTGVAGQLTLTNDRANHQTVISGDTDGDGKADLVIDLLGHHTDFTNFVL